jgi:hypothetical protein
MGGAAAHREFEELIVFRIAADGDPRVHIDPFRFGGQSRQEISNISIVDVATELFPAQNFV